MEVQVLSHRWRFVSWALELPRVSSSCESLTFNLDGYVWQIKLSGLWNSKAKCESWDIYLKRFSEKSLSLKVLVYVKDRSGKIKLLYTEPCVLIDQVFFHLTRKMLVDECGITGDKITMFLQFDLDSKCPRDILEEPFTNSEEIQEKLSNYSCLTSLSEDIGKLFNKEEHSDVVLNCGDRTFLANKKILSARSEVFAAMFKNKMTSVPVLFSDTIDIKPSVLEQFLRYIYSGRLEAPCMDLVFDLYRAGDKYAIPSLKRKCGSFMVDNLSEDNVCEILVLADTFRDIKLLEVAMNYAVDRDGFLGSDKWFAFTKSHPAISLKVFVKFHRK